MNIFVLAQKSTKFMTKISCFNITKKISFNKKREIGIEKLKNQMITDNQDPKTQVIKTIKNQTENLLLKSKLENVGDYIDADIKREGQEFGFDFSKFKKRNEDLSKTNASSVKDKSPAKKGKKEKTDSQEDLKKILDEETYEKLEEMITIDKTTEKIIGKTTDLNDNRGVLTKLSVDADQIIDKNGKVHEMNSQLDDDDENFSSKVLVHRPERHHLWGLGEEVKNKKKKKFTIGFFPTVDEIVSYLEIYNLTDIIIISRKDLGLNHLKNMGIICTGFNAKHIYKSAKDLTIEVKKLNLRDLPEVPTIYGRRDEEWYSRLIYRLIFEIGEIAVHFFTEKYREDVDLIGKWTRKDDPEYTKFREKLNLQIREKRNSKFK